MELERRAHRLGLAFPDARRSDDVGEQEGRHAGRERGGDHAPAALDARLEVGRLVEDGALELDGFGAGRDAELLAESLAELAERPERVGLPPAPVLGEHEVAPQALVERMLGDEPLGLGEDAVEVAEIQPDAEQGLAGSEPELLEPLARRQRPLGEAGVEQGLAPPAGERRGQDPRRRLRLGGRQGAAAGGLLLERGRVHLVAGTDDEPVADLGLVLDPVPAQRPAQIRDVALDGLGCARGRVALPEVLAQPPDGDEGVRVDEET